MIDRRTFSALIASADQPFRGLSIFGDAFVDRAEREPS